MNENDVDPQPEIQYVYEERRRSPFLGWFLGTLVLVAIGSGIFWLGQRSGSDSDEVVVEDNGVFAAQTACFNNVPSLFYDDAGNCYSDAGLTVLVDISGSSEAAAPAVPAAPGAPAAAAPVAPAATTAPGAPAATAAPAAPESTTTPTTSPTGAPTTEPTAPSTTCSVDVPNSGYTLRFEDRSPAGDRVNNNPVSIAFGVSGGTISGSEFDVSLETDISASGTFSESCALALHLSAKSNVGEWDLVGTCPNGPAAGCSGSGTIAVEGQTFTGDFSFD